LLLAANLLIPAAILVFATGFFPYKPLLPGLATYDAVTEYGEPPAAPFDRLVFMVIDALRRFVALSMASAHPRLTGASGIVTLSTPQTAASSSLNRRLSLPTSLQPGAQLMTRPRLIRDGAALPFTAHATSPTVTMPRLKAITTGSIPSFLDVVLNLDEGDESSSLASQDTWLAQMKAKGTGKLVMYGDDTWLKLFPGTFDRADGTTSFFVSVRAPTDSEPEE
jgi:ethanolaminephosphotransferase